MRILVLGGTRFVGRHITEKLLENGQKVTLFNRGQTNPGLFPQAEHLVGDRDGALDALVGKSWDAVIDVNGYVPRVVRDSAELLRSAAGQYIYVSTGGVYRQPFAPNGNETHPTVDTSMVGESEDVGKFYSELKLLCEKVVLETFGGDGLVLRIGLQVGPYDYTDRATYWIWRVLQGGRMLAPGNPGDAYQTIDSRDLARFILVCLRDHLSRVYNVAGRSITWGQWLTEIQAVTGVQVDLTWIDDEDFLKAHDPQGQGLFTAYPLYIPEAWGEWWKNNTSKAESAGLRYRSYAETIRAILEWRPDLRSEKLTAGLTLDREQQILQAWDHRS